MSVKQLNSRLVDTCTHFISTTLTIYITCTYCSMKTVSEEAIGSWLASDSVQAYVHGIHEGKVSLVWKDLGVHLWNIVKFWNHT